MASTLPTRKKLKRRQNGELSSNQGESSNWSRLCLVLCFVIAAHTFLTSNYSWDVRDLDMLVSFQTSRVTDGYSSSSSSSQSISQGLHHFEDQVESLEADDRNEDIKEERPKEKLVPSEKVDSNQEEELDAVSLKFLTYNEPGCAGEVNQTATITDGSASTEFIPNGVPKSAKLEGAGIAEIFIHGRSYFGSIAQSEGCVDFFHFFNPPHDKVHFVLHAKENTFLATKQISDELQAKFSTVASEHDNVQPRTWIVYSATSSEYFGYQLLANAYSFLQSNQTNAHWMRLLTSRVPDDLSERFPTFAAPTSLYSRHYVPINKPDIIDKWFQSPDAPHPDDTIVIIDPDNWLLKDVNPWTKDVSRKQAVGQVAYYGYSPKVTELWKELCLENCDNKIDPVGVPYFVKASDLKDIAPLWRSYSIEISRRHFTNKTFADYYDKSLGVGWAAEMFGYNYACAHLGIKTKVVDNVQLRDTSTDRNWKTWSKTPMIHMGRAWFPKNETEAAAPWRHENDDGFSAQGIQVWCKCNTTAGNVQPWPLPSNLDIVSYHTLRILHDSKDFFGPVPVNKTFRPDGYWASSQ